MFRKLHRQDGSEVWVNLDLVTSITRAQSGPGSALHFRSSGSAAPAWPPVEAGTPAPPLVVREWAEDIVGKG